MNFAISRNDVYEDIICEPALRSDGVADCLELMRVLIQYRFEKQLYHELLKRAEQSMLGIDALVLIYHFAKIAEGDILEIGSFTGGATIVAGLGVRHSGRPKRIISIEPGGQVENHRLATRNILKDLKKNLARAKMLDDVTLINGFSFETSTILAVREVVGPGEVGLFVFDADADLKRPIEYYQDRFIPNCWVVIDDYLGNNHKGGPTRAQVDKLISHGQLQPLGLYGWGTWVGRWVG